MDNWAEGWPEKVGFLADKLSKADAVRKAGAARRGEPPEETLAHALVDIEEECRTLVNEHLPRLMNAASPDELDDALEEVRFGLKHIVYHIKDSPYLRAVVDD